MTPPAAFFQTLYGDDPPGDLVLWTRQDKRTHFFPARDFEAAGRLAEQLAATCDVYCGVALQDKAQAFARWRADYPTKPGEPTTRGYSETTIALPGLGVSSK